MKKKEEKLIEQIKDKKLKDELCKKPEEVINRIITKFALLIYNIIEENKGGNLVDQMMDQNLKKEISNRPEEIINNFGDFIK